jgi:hypothetical protein
MTGLPLHAALRGEAAPRARYGKCHLKFYGYANLKAQPFLSISADLG